MLISLEIYIFQQNIFPWHIFQQNWQKLRKISEMLNKNNEYHSNVHKKINLDNSVEKQIIKKYILILYFAIEGLSN